MYKVLKFYFHLSNYEAVENKPLELLSIDPVVEQRVLPINLPLPIVFITCVAMWQDI